MFDNLTSINFFWSPFGGQGVDTLPKATECAVVSRKTQTQA